MTQKPPKKAETRDTYVLNKRKAPKETKPAPEVKKDGK